MTRLRRFRLRFAALLVSAAATLRVGAPAVDAFLHHRAGTVESTGIHLDTPGGCGDHAERCAVTGQSSGVRFTAVRFVVAPTSLALAAETAAPHTPRPTRLFCTLHHSRAPPITSV